MISKVLWLGLVCPLLTLSADISESTDRQAARAWPRISSSTFGPNRTSPDVPLPRHAYSPFEQIGAPPPYQPQAGRDYREGELVIRLAPEVTVNPRSAIALQDAQGHAALTSLSRLNAALADQGIAELQPVFPTARPPARTRTADSPPPVDLTRWYRARAQGPSLTAATKLAAEPGVEVAEPDYLRKLADASSEFPRDPAIVGARGGIRRMDDPPALPDATTDPLYAQQWHLAAVNAPQAWAYLQSQGLPPGGSRDVVVAVIDTGVDTTHPDLAANLWVNSREIAGNGIDDDGNGFVDDVHGCAVVSSSSSQSGNPADDHGHGTHVAGIIAAQAGNHEGGVGIAYNCQIMAIKAAQYSGVLASSDIAEAIHYAVQQGADIINMSFGGYVRSQVEEDALAVAFGQCVLVAAAGNDGIPNELKCCTCARAMYPAAYNWVLGVMASAPTPDEHGTWRAAFSNWDCTPQNSIEYELLAPGVDIWSTLPTTNYVAWDGTSMAAPLVSGLAALARTKWSDKDQYSSRFIMGQIAANASPVANALATLTTVPTPQLSYLEHWLFDTTDQAEGNDGDGIVDAGETVDLAVVIRNHWGKAEEVKVTLEAWAEGAFQADPYVTWLTSTVDYGAIGSFNWDDNGLIYDTEGVITGVRSPFRFVVSPDCPNDHVIPFRLTMSYRNGLDLNDAQVYTTQSHFSLMVQRGRELPRIISQNMTLTKDCLWLVPDRTLIESNAVVRVEPGTQVEFWSLDPRSPYASQAKAYLQVEGLFLAQGTLEDPVEFFPNPLVPDGGVEIVPWHGGLGRFEFAYTRIQSPMCLRADGTHRFDVIDHCYFASSATRVRGGYRVFPLVPLAGGGRVYRSIYHALGQGCDSGCDLYAGTEISSPSWESLYDSCAFVLQGDASLPGLVQAHNTYLRNYRPQQGVPGRSSLAQIGALWQATTPVRAVFPTNWQGHAYFALSRRFSLETAEAIARNLGGHLATVNDALENAFLTSYRQQRFTGTAFAASYPAEAAAWDQFSGDFSVGLTYRDDLGTWQWTSGEEASYTNWQGNEPNEFTVKSNEPLGGVLSGDGSWYDTRSRWGPWIVEIPAPADPVALDAALLTCHDSGTYNTVFQDNAILVEWWNPDRAFWPLVDVLTFANGQFPRGDRLAITRNFWGTSSSTLMDQLLHDGNDDFNLGRFIYQPMLSEPPVDCYPFVVSVTLTAGAGPSVTVVGAEPVTFTVTFNRDMDPDVQPQVSFGPDTPITDYTIHPVGGGWQDPRTWIGTFNVTPVTGDGYQLIRVAGAVAADDPWLVTGDDAGRFRFEIITSGTESMNLQATGSEGQVNLSWMQDDFDLLAGYNLYRATAPDGTYTRINSAILPSQVKRFTDTAVQPGAPYYYRFTVVKTDMSESDFSNTAQGTPLDTVPPVITHSPLTSAAPGLPLTLFADVTDNVAVQSVTLFFRQMAEASYHSRTMTRATGNRFAATVEGSRLVSPGLEYYLEASDGVSLARSGRADLPWPVTVNDRPVVTAVSLVRGPASGGTPVTVAGTNFKAGARVRFGDTPASTVMVVSSSQITCVAPPHYPAVVDVTVSDPSGQSGSLLRGFTYFSDTVSLGLPATGGGQHDVVEVPLTLANASGLAAADLRVTFDPAVLRAQSARAGNLTVGWTLAAASPASGAFQVSMASGGGTSSGSGVLCYLAFEVIGGPGTTSPLRLAAVALNDGAIPAETADGSLAVNLVYDVSGRVAYWNGSRPIPGVQLALQGDRLFAGETSSNGTYRVAGANAGDYMLTPSKSDGATGISAYDASLVLQHAAALALLSGPAATAADVDRSGAITSMDAFYILQSAVGLVDLPFPGAGTVWRFTPANRTVANLAGDLAGQDFTAILLGEVSGNWGSGAARAGVALHGPDDSPVILSLRPDGSTSQGVRHWLLARIPEPGLHSLDITLASDTSTRRVNLVESGCLTAGWLLAANTNSAGQARIALAGALPVRGVGGLVSLLISTDDGPWRIASAVAEEGGWRVELDPTGSSFDADSDGDGLSDWQEVLTGSDPGAGDDALGLTQVRLADPKNLELTWRSVAGRRYQVETRSSLLQGNWTIRGTPVTATGPTTRTAVSISPTESQAYFRVRLEE